MALIPNATIVYQSPDVDDRFVAYAIRNVTTGDTFDTSTLFSKIFFAVFLPATDRALLASATFVGTLVTFNAIGLAGDGGFLVILGEGPQ